jgi:DNA-binding CsgD family transcriptional regulator/PAS domain-containing protein
MISVGDFSELVDAIYAAALDPSEWTRFCKLLTLATDSLLGGVVIADIATNRVLEKFGHGFPDGYFERYHATVGINPMLPYLALAKTGDLLVNSFHIPEDEFTKSRFYREFAQPMNLRDSMFVVCLRSGPRVASVGMNRSLQQPLYTAAEGDLLRSLVPHICRAMIISDALDLRTVKSDALEAALDGLAAGVFLLDDQGNVLHQNKAAARLARLGDVLTIRNKRLWPINAASRDGLAAALRQTPQDALPPASGAAPASIVLGTADGTGGMIATLLPLAGRGSESARHTDARWAAFVQDPHVAVPMPGEAFGKLYSLTPAELRVALAVVPGLTPEAAADMLGVALPTVRTHLQRIFTKTGTNRHADLVRLMMATMPPLG